jgi:hypothetical protein
MASEFPLRVQEMCMLLNQPGIPILNLNRNLPFVSASYRLPVKNLINH